jgi:hypothetical protein
MSKNLKNPDKPDKFQFLTEKSIRQKKLELTRWQSGRLRSKLPRGIYWLQLEKSGLVHWNYCLLRDFLINGDCPGHQALVEEYIATLPQAT